MLYRNLVKNVYGIAYIVMCFFSFCRSSCCINAFLLYSSFELIITSSKELIYSSRCGRLFIYEVGRYSKIEDESCDIFGRGRGRRT